MNTTDILVIILHLWTWLWGKKNNQVNDFQRTLFWIYPAWKGNAGLGRLWVTWVSVPLPMWTRLLRVPCTEVVNRARSHTLMTGGFSFAFDFPSIPYHTAGFAGSQTGAGEGLHRPQSQPRVQTSVVEIDVSESASWRAAVPSGRQRLRSFTLAASVRSQLCGDDTHGHPWWHFLNHEGSCFLPSLSSGFPFHIYLLISNLYRYGI